MMNKKTIRQSLASFFQGLYKKLFKIHDTPQRIALGLGLGVALGLVPGTGPLAALFAAVLFKVNRASALLGSLVTNTWLSLVTFLLALRIGSVIFRVNTEVLKSEWGKLSSNFQWSYLFKSSFFKVILPVLSGYLVIAILLGLFVYLTALVIIKKIKPALRRQAGRKDESHRRHK